MTEEVKNQKLFENEAEGMAGQSLFLCAFHVHKLRSAVAISLGLTC